MAEKKDGNGGNENVPPVTPVGITVAIQGMTTPPALIIAVDDNFNCAFMLRDSECQKKLDSLCSKVAEVIIKVLFQVAMKSSSEPSRIIRPFFGGVK